MLTVMTRRARADLKAIARYIARDNPRRAVTFADELLEKCRDIARMPVAFPLVEGHEAEGVRRRVHGNYLIHYVVQGSTVVILHVTHAGQHLPDILKDP